MNRRLRNRVWAGVAVMAVALVLLGISVRGGRPALDTESAAVQLGRRLEERMALLDGFVERASKEPSDSWVLLEDLPEDMVIYRYGADTLLWWAHQFPLANDDIVPMTVVQRLGDSRGNLVSPLSAVEETVTFVNYGPKWYLVKAVPAPDNGLFIAGLEVMDELGENPFTIQPISASVGSPVSVDGTPLFKLTSETVSLPGGHDPVLFWTAILLLLAAGLYCLQCHPALWTSAVVAFVLEAFLAAVYFYGRGLSGVTQVFSPLLYADGSHFYSLGAVFLTNLALSVPVICLYLVRRGFLRRLLRKKTRWQAVIWTVLLLVTAVLLCAYIWFAFKSIILNSGICLELYKVNLLDIYTALVYLSFLLLAMVLPLLSGLAAPLLRRLSGLRFDPFSRAGRTVFALCVGLFFVLASSILGFRKERNRVEVWANRLAMDRDITLEIQLRSVEAQIAADPVIGPLSALEGSADLIGRRLTGSYFARLTQDYDISVVPLTTNPAVDVLFNERIRSGARLSDNSHFFYSSGSNGRARYSGIFTYYTEGRGASSLLILVESKSNREDRGYLSLLGIAEPGRVSIPPQYSYARYLGGKLVMYKGPYGYPTEADASLPADGYTHFIDRISDEETVVLSREKTDLLSYCVEGVLFAITAFLLITLLSFRRRRRREKSWFRTRISVVIYMSLTVTLVAMAGFSVWFVYRRNNADTRTIMISRINSLQSILQSRLRQVSGSEQLKSSLVLSSVEEAGNELKCDISLYSASGKLVYSTTPEVYDRMILGHRIDEQAYYDIVYGHKRYCIQPERFGRRRYWALYAPVFNGAGDRVAIVSSPYTDQSYDLQNEALMHVATIIAVFVLLLMLARIVTEEVINRMFRPLSEMSKKMKVSDVDHLEYIIYEQDDEISSLVRAYNLMVHDLSESTRALAQAERDKAWSAMARQVAHEIKNPLTPIKLQLQMLIRMKESGNPSWEAKFGEVSRNVLEHIDILADTANEFSTFAKLYSEEPVEIDLDALVQEEVSMFGAREDISFAYYGLEGARITGPKPQLTRVLVNLVTNAVQAVEGQADARVVVSLRNSLKDGYYDLVVEDNGPGVREENRSRLFTPDFTTKSRGTGLGLAICRNIIDRCGGEIFYTRSFSLGGACFTVRYPKRA